MRDEEIVHVVGVLFLFRQDALEHQTRRRILVAEITDQLAIVIDGETLRYALDEKNNLRELFLNLGCQCETVVCCRVSPAQKAQTVKLASCIYYDSFPMLT